jgi:hypothetical protein
MKFNTVSYFKKEPRKILSILLPTLFPHLGTTIIIHMGKINLLIISFILAVNHVFITHNSWLQEAGYELWA